MKGKKFREELRAVHALLDDAIAYHGDSKRRARVIIDLEEACTILEECLKSELNGAFLLSARTPGKLARRKPGFPVSERRLAYNAKNAARVARWRARKKLEKVDVVLYRPEPNFPTVPLTIPENMGDVNSSAKRRAERRK